LKNNASHIKKKIGTYPYGFQGQMRSDNISGSGNSYTAAYWQYDTRLGRRWNNDPITYPWQSTYAVFNNNPIYFTDPDGLEGKGIKGLINSIKEVIKHPFDKDARARHLESKKGNKLKKGKVTVFDTERKEGIDPTESTADNTKRNPLKIKNFAKRIVDALSGFDISIEFPELTGFAVTGVPNATGTDPRGLAEMNPRANSGFSYDKSDFNMNPIVDPDKYIFKSSSGKGFSTPFEGNTLFNKTVVGSPAGMLRIITSVSILEDFADYSIDVHVKTRLTYTMWAVTRTTRSGTTQVGWQYAPPGTAGALPWYKRSLSYLWRFYFNGGFRAVNMDVINLNAR
jgi:RHS repeat-associated protein